MHRGCLPRKHHRVSSEDIIQRLAEGVERLSHITKSPNDGIAKDLKEYEQALSEDVRKLLRVVLEVVRELSVPEPDRHSHSERSSEKRVMSMEEGMELFEHLLAYDVPMRLVEALPRLNFEARKDAMNIFSVLLWPEVSQRVGHSFRKYLRAHSSIFHSLVWGFQDEDTALHCGVILRSCMRYKELAQAFLESRLLLDLIKHAQHPAVDISGDAFGCLREALLTHRELASQWLEANFTDFFGPYSELLHTENYIVQRQALILLSNMLLDYNFRRVMVSFVSEEKHLQICMNLLRDPSHTIQVETFHTFKLFVANPSKPPRIEQILFKNRSRLSELLQGLRASCKHEDRVDADFATTIERLQLLTGPMKATSPTRQPPATLGERASPTSQSVQSSLPIRPMVMCL